MKLFHFDERSHFSFETFWSSCASVGAFERNLDIRNIVCSLVVLYKKHAICQSFFATVDYLPEFHCENPACHAFYTAFSVLKLHVNLLFNKKRKT